MAHQLIDAEGNELKYPASATADVGGSLKTGGVNKTTAPTLADGQRGETQLDTRANTKVALVSGNGTTLVVTTGNNADGVSATHNGLDVTQFGFLYNGTTWDRQRGNLDTISAVPSAAYTTTQTQADQTNYNHRGIQVVLDMTVVGTGSVTLEIDGKDPVSGKYYSLLTGAAVVSNSTNVYTIYPGNTVAANVSASTVLPRTWRIKVTANNANSATYSVGAALIL